tara:strand:+ start:89 stop:952 length:864 start_codon:yes stop_codon:yes gene_type:complete
MNKDFAVFIMVYGRPQKEWTYKTLRKCGYTGQVYFVGDDLDVTINEYKKKYGDKLIIFDKKKSAKGLDTGDNTGDFRSTLFASNKIFELAKERGIKYFFIMCDDYFEFNYRFDNHCNYVTNKYVGNLDATFNSMVKFMKTNTQVSSIAMAQTGDFIGGEKGSMVKGGSIIVKRKVMNTFLCSTERRFKFMGRLNEDITTYINLGSKGFVFLTIPLLAINQKQTQSAKGGLTEVYKKYGTYVKSFFSVMYNPSSVKVYLMGESNKRLHHRVSWNNAVPKILNEKHKVI